MTVDGAEVSNEFVVDNSEESGKFLINLKKGLKHINWDWQWNVFWMKSRMNEKKTSENDRYK